MQLLKLNVTRSKLNLLLLLRPPRLLAFSDLSFENSGFHKTVQHPSMKITSLRLILSIPINLLNGLVILISGSLQSKIGKPAVILL